MSHQSHPIVIPSSVFYEVLPDNDQGNSTAHRQQIGQANLPWISGRPSGAPPLGFPILLKLRLGARGIRIVAFDGLGPAATCGEILPTCPFLLAMSYTRRRSDIDAVHARPTR